MPRPERHWCSMPGTVGPQEAAPHVDPQACHLALAARGVGRPPATSGSRFWRTLTTCGVIVTSRPQAPMPTPPLNAATSVAAWAGRMGAVYRYGPPPGLTEPEYSRAASRPVSSHAIPAGCVPPGGLRVVS